MLTPCSPCICYGAPCEQCMFGYYPAKKQHDLMYDLILSVERGEKPLGYALVDRYKFLHRDWESQMELRKEETMIFTGEKTCEKCSHKNVCSIKELFENTKIKVDDLSASMFDSFEISLRCKEFREDVAVRTPFGK